MILERHTEGQSANSLLLIVNPVRLILGTDHCFRTPHATTILFNSAILISSGESYRQLSSWIEVRWGLDGGFTHTLINIFLRTLSLTPIHGNRKVRRDSPSLSSPLLLMTRTSFFWEVHHILTTYLILPQHQS